MLIYFCKLAKETFLQSFSSRTPRSCTEFRAHVTQLCLNGVSATLESIPKCQGVTEKQPCQLSAEFFNVNGLFSLVYTL